MSKYEEMCAVLKTSRETWSAYQQRSIERFATLYNGFINYCAIPTDRISYAPVDEDAKPDTIYALPTVIHFNPNNGFWQVGVRITLPGTPRPSIVRLIWSLKEQDGEVSIKLDDLEPWEFNINDATQRNEFYDIAVGEVKHIFTGEIQQYLGASAVVKS